MPKDENKRVVALVAGTRPEVIKMSPVYFALQESDSLRPVILSTAQHRQMLDQAFAAFGITPEFDLDLMRPGQDLTGLTARVLEAVGGFLKEQQPDAILTQGDTTSVLASSIAAFYAKIPVGHVEAGPADAQHGFALAGGDEPPASRPAVSLVLPTDRAQPTEPAG